MKKAICIFLFVFSIHYFLSAQFLEIGTSLAATTYRGDLSPSIRLKNTRPGGSIFLNHIINKGIQISHQVGFWNISGNDNYYFNSFQQQRGQHFSRSLIEISSQIEYHFIDYLVERPYRKVTPYFIAGIGVFYMMGDLSSSKKVYRIQPVIPLGVGLKYPLTRQWNVGWYIIAKKTFTDYLDNTGYSSQDPKLANGSLTGSDWYFVTGFSVGYTLYWVRCPKCALHIKDQNR